MATNQTLILFSPFSRSQGVIYEYEFDPNFVVSDSEEIDTMCLMDDEPLVAHFKDRVADLT